MIQKLGISNRSTPGFCRINDWSVCAYPVDAILTDGNAMLPELIEGNKQTSTGLTLSSVSTALRKSAVGL